MKELKTDPALSVLRDSMVLNVLILFVKTDLPIHTNRLAFVSLPIKVTRCVENVSTVQILGKFCGDLETEDVYLLYNSRVAVLGPLGAISIIPLIMIYYGCEHFARKRQIRRIERLWIDQADVSIDSEKVKHLLEN